MAISRKINESNFSEDFWAVTIYMHLFMALTNEPPKPVSCKNKLRINSVNFVDKAHSESKYKLFGAA